MGHNRQSRTAKSVPKGPAESSAGETPTNEAGSGFQTSNGGKQRRLWLCLRVVDYRLQALCPVDPAYPLGEQEWSDIGPDTTITTDRESVFQLAREHGGLLLSASGLPSLGKLGALLGRVKAESLSISERSSPADPIAARPGRNDLAGEEEVPF